MFKRISVLVLAVFFMISGKAFANQLLTNGNFESGITSSWTINGPDWAAEGTVVHEGAVSAKNTIATNISPNNYFTQLYQDVTAGFTVGQPVYATLQGKTNFNILSNARAGLLVQFFNGASEIPNTSVSSQIGGLTDWRNLYASRTVPANTTKIRVSCFTFAPVAEFGLVQNGVAYFDEAVLSTTFIAPPPVQTTLINPGFENGLNDWTVIQPAAANPGITVDNTNVDQGLFSAKNTFRTTGIDYFAAAYQDLAYTSGTLWASARIKTNISLSAPQAIVTLKFEYYNNAGTKLGETQASPLTGVNDWKTVLINGVIPVGGTTKVRVMVLGYVPVAQSAAANNSTAYFDNVIFSYSPLGVNNSTTLQNGNFENGLNSWSDQFGFPATITNSPVHGGVIAAKKTIGAIIGQDYYSQILQDVFANANGTTPFSTGTPVYATAYIKTNINPVTKGKAGLQFEFINASGQVINDGNGDPIVINSGIGGNTDWRKLYIAGTTPAGATRVRVSGYQFARETEASQAGDSYYDDFEFSLTPLTPPAPKTALLNAGFENGLNDWNEPNFPGEVSTAIKHNGNYAAVYEIGPNDLNVTDYFGNASQTIKVNAGAFFKASGWVKTDINVLSLSAAGILVEFLDNNGQVMAPTYTQSVGGQTNWTKLTISKQVPAGARKARFSFFLFGDQASAFVGDKAYFDDGNAGGTLGRCTPGLGCI